MPPTVVSVAQPIMKLPKERLDSPERLTKFFDIWEISSREFDEAALDGLMSPTFRFVDPKGNPWSWPELKAEIKRARPSLRVEVKKDFEILRYSDHTVLKRCVATLEGTFLGQTWTGPYRWSNLFVNEQGDWKLAYYQLTPIPVE